MERDNEPKGMFDTKRDRAVHTFTIPESLRDIVTTVGLVELKATQELQAAKVGRFDMLKSQYEAMNLSIATLDGKVVDHSGIELDRFWENTNPRVRSLLLQAYQKISSPTVEETDDFFGSEKVEVVKV